MSKLPRLPQYALLEEIAAWLTAASEEEWTARSVLSRLLEEHRYLTAEGAAGSSRVWGPDEVWVVLHRGDVLIDALNGKEWVLPFSRKLMVLEPIDQFIRDLCDAGAVTATSGLTDQGRQRYRARRCFCPSDVMLQREVAETLLSDFDRLVFDIGRGEHKDLVALLDRVGNGHVDGALQGTQHMPVAPASKKKPGRPPSNAPGRLVVILNALEQFAASTEEAFNRQAMPGPIGKDWHDEGSFHWLCAKIDPVFRKAKATFEKHRSGLCAVGQYAKLTDFYLRALPVIAPKLGSKPDVRSTQKRTKKVH